MFLVPREGSRGGRMSSRGGGGGVYKGGILGVPTAAHHARGAKLSPSQLASQGPSSGTIWGHCAKHHVQALVATPHGTLPLK